MAAAELHAWLQGPRPYHEGLALLKAHSTPDSATLFLLDLGETSISRLHLVQAMQALVDDAVQRTMATPTVQQELVTKADIIAERKQLARDPRSDGFAAKQLPPALEALRNQVKVDLKEMSYLRARLETLPSDADRYRDALRIVELDAKVASAYTRMDAWEATGRDPGDAAEAARPKNGAELRLELSNIVSYLARHNSGKRRLSDAKLAQYTHRKAELQKLINAL